MTLLDKLLIAIGGAVGGAAICAYYGKSIMPSREAWLMGWEGSFGWRDVLFIGMGLCLGITAYLLMRIDIVLKEAESAKLVETVED